MTREERCLVSYSRAAANTIRDIREQHLTPRQFEVKVRRLHMMVARYEKGFRCICDAR